MKRRFFGVGLALALALSCSSAAETPSLRTSTIVSSGDWSVWAFVLNDVGTVVWAGGGWGGPDGLVRYKNGAMQKFVARGDPVTGVPGSLFTSFGGRSGNFALNNRDEVAFSASYAACDDASQIDFCSREHQSHSGLFLYSGGEIRNIALEGDPVPGSEDRIFQFFQDVRLNNTGMILFRGHSGAAVRPPVEAVQYAYFLWSSGRLERIPSRDATVGLQGEGPIAFSDDGAVTLASFGYLNDAGVFRFADGRLTRLLGTGDSIPGAGTINMIYAAVANTRGEVAFQVRYGATVEEQGLFLLEGDGTIDTIARHGDRAPFGGTFLLWHETSDRFGNKYKTTVGMNPALDNSGDVVFQAPVKDGSAPSGLFIASGGAIRTVMSGIGLPPFFGVRNVVLNDLSMAFIRTPEGRSSLWLGDELHSIDLPVSSYPAADSAPYALNQAGDVVVRTDTGLFLVEPPSAAVPNRDFEERGASALPRGWETAWTNSGTGEAFLFSGAGTEALNRSSVLRLHVGPSGGSTFVLSETIPVAAGASYRIAPALRYALESSSDSVLVSVVQLDRAGAVVGFDEVTGRRGENFWTWQRKGLVVHTAPDAVSIRIRIGLVAASESYLDVDDVR